MEPIASCLTQPNFSGMATVRGVQSQQQGRGYTSLRVGQATFQHSAYSDATLQQLPRRSFTFSLDELFDRAMFLRCCLGLVRSRSPPPRSFANDKFTGGSRKWEGSSSGSLRDGSPPMESRDKAPVGEICGTSPPEVGDILQIIHTTMM